jgi:hypothetical protein
MGYRRGFPLIWRRRLAGGSGCYDDMMRVALDPFRLLLICLAGWFNQRQQDVIDYLQEENRVLREHLEGKRLRFNDAAPTPGGQGQEIGLAYASGIDHRRDSGHAAGLAPQADRQEI